MITTVSDLIEALENMDPDAEVRLATQPTWPLAFRVACVTDAARFDGCDHVVPQDDCPDCEADRDSSVVWIAAGEHPADSPYAPAEAWQ